MLTIYYSNHLDVLKDLLIELYRQNLPTNPLADEHIMVHSSGMSQWLQLEMAKEVGISAGVNFSLPASFLWNIYTRIMPDVPGRSSFDKELMTWKLMDLLSGVDQDPDFASLSHYLVQGDDIRKFQLAGKIADIFDQYLVYRPDWILDWEQNKDTSSITSEHPWQPKLWRALVSKTADMSQSLWHRANLHHRFLKIMQNHDASEQLPNRLFVIGISALAPQFQQAIEVISNQCDVHLMVTNPCKYYWGDERDPKYLGKLAARKWTNRETTDDLVKRVGDGPGCSEEGILFDHLNRVGNPLLGSMGKLGRDYLYQLHGMDATDIDVFVSDYKNTLLGSIQKDIFELHDRTSPGQQTCRQCDSSVQFHSCHSPLREVEILYDRLLEMFENDPQLTPKDIVIMSPDIDSYIPWIQAVFSSLNDNRRIPFAISDVSAQSTHAVLAAFMKLLELDKNRCSASEIIELLEVPAIQNRFKLTSDDLLILKEWIHESGIRWGLTPAHQSGFDLPELQVNSWLFGIRRMLLGYAMPESTGVYNDILPMDAVLGMNAVLAGYLANFIDCAEQLITELNEVRSIEQWIQFTSQLQERFFLPRSTDDEVALKLIMDKLSHLYEQLKQAQYRQQLSRNVLIKYLQDCFTQERSNQRFLAGQVNFCTFMPMRSIPFKVICLLGMHDGAYPRNIAPSGFDLIAQHSRRGDRSRRVDDRYLFLEALVSAQDILYISFVGRRIQDNSERMPSVLVTELLNYCEHGFGLSYEKLVIEHTLQPFNRNNFMSPSEQLQDTCCSYSYINEWLPAANSQKDGKHIQFIREPLPIEEGFDFTEVELNDLLSFYSNPCRYFFNRRLKVNFSSRKHILEETETFSIGSLENYQLKTQLITHLLDDSNAQDISKKLQLTGKLPHCAFGQIFLDEQLNDLHKMASRLKLQLEHRCEDQEINLQIRVPDHISCRSVHLTGWLKGMFTSGMIRFRPARFKGKDLIKCWIEHLCQCMQGDSVLTRIYTTEKEYQLPVVDIKESEYHLATLIRYFYAGQNRPLPWFPETAYSWLKSSRSDNPEKAEQNAEKTFSGDSRHSHSESQDDYIRRVYPELAPVFAEMIDLTQDIFAPAFKCLQEAQQ